MFRVWHFFSFFSFFQEKGRFTQGKKRFWPKRKCQNSSKKSDSSSLLIVLYHGRIISLLDHGTPLPTPPPRSSSTEKTTQRETSAHRRDEKMVVFSNGTGEGGRCQIPPLGVFQLAADTTAITQYGRRTRTGGKGRRRRSNNNNNNNNNVDDFATTRVIGNAAAAIGVSANNGL